MKKKLFYVETEKGKCLRVGLTEKSVKNIEINLIGVKCKINEVRIATEEDIHIIQLNGGFIPKV